MMKKFAVVIIGIFLTAVIFVLKTNIGSNAQSNASLPPPDEVDGLVHDKLVEVINLPEKFWVHRCNSVEKAQAMSKKFCGIEIDANFHSEEVAGKKFDIQHDNKQSVQITLKDFMPLFSETDTKIWFDYKNLNSENAQASLEELKTLLEQYGVDKSRLIIENHNFKDLKVFHDAGFYTSFYVTVKNDLDKEAFCEEVKAAVESGNVDAVSFPVNYYKLVKSTNISVDLLTWQPDRDRWWTFLAEHNFRKVVDDPQVKVVLVKMQTPFDRYLTKKTGEKFNLS